MIENKNLPEMEPFAKRAEDLVESDPDVEQVVVVWTEKGHELHLINHDVNTKIQYAVLCRLYVEGFNS